VVALCVATSVAIGALAYFVGRSDAPYDVVFPARDYLHEATVTIRKPLVGVYYTHYKFSACRWNDSGILARTPTRQDAMTLHSQLMRMRQVGVAAIELVIWHMTNPLSPVGEGWGVVPSRGGELRDPYRRNFVRYLSEIKRFGFKRLTIALSPQWTNDPSSSNYDPHKIDENWEFISNVRSLAKRYGPPDTRFDLLNEGAPSNYLPRRIHEHVASYIASMYARYARRFGRSDVVISSIAPLSPNDHGDRLENLIDIFNSTRVGQPHSYDVHIAYAGRTLRSGNLAYALTASDRVLAANGLSQPLILGQVPYADARTARAIRNFLRTTTRPVDEVVEWFERRNSECNASPPYSPGAYRVLWSRGVGDS
jgi:hypothetical protein